VARSRGTTVPNPGDAPRTPGPPEPHALVPGGVYDYGLIGNLHTAALVSRFGSIDWACFPRFASPSVFARILDPKIGGFHQIVPTEPYRSSQTYVPSTAILRTEFRLSGRRRLVVRDFMPILPRPWADTVPLIVRLAEATGGAVPLRVEMAPRFDYGSQAPNWSSAGVGFVATKGRRVLGYRASEPARIEGERVGVDATLRSGHSASFEIYGAASRPTRRSVEELLKRTEGFWGHWSHLDTSPIHLLAGRWHAWVERSELTLKLLSNADTGAFVAAPTTSLPEWPGGTRNWDYRYVWIRDAAFAAQSLLLMGHIPEARGFLHWTLRRRDAHAGRVLRVVYGAHGETDLSERDLPYLAGYANSRPVRVGNAAAEQFQLDIYGEFLDAAHLLSQIDPDALDGHWPAVERLVEEVRRLWTRPDRGIWEVRGPPAHYVHSKLMAWVALDRGATLARAYGRTSQVAYWSQEADRVQRTIIEHGFDPRRETFVQAFDRPGIDAANLRIPLVGFLEADDPRVAGTVLRVERELSLGPFVYRYSGDDGIEGPEASFLPCSFWLVDCLARAGELPRARQNFEQLLRIASPLGLFPEEFDARSGTPLGNYPQAFTHIALLRSALALGLANTSDRLLEPFPWLRRGRTVPRTETGEDPQPGGATAPS
jgi:GH15 family glucan-1,4-alpha-glucosidase